jgi:ectoine hydroxylase-related dioxygenase (phytanoyl-CoA dioxygenase family)
MNCNDREALDSAYQLSPQQARSYRENGFVRLSQVLPGELVEHYRGEITRIVEELSGQRAPLEQRSTYDQAFLQITNLWRKSAAVREFAFGRRLARIAAELMGCRGVRLWHDQALYKEAGGGFTPWHADQYYWPLSNERTTTAWIPLLDVSLEMGPLAFAPKSHRLQAGRELAIGDESETTLKEKLAAYGCDEQPFALGDVSFHSGWTFHRAGGNRSPRMREVFTIIYMDQDMRLVEPRNPNQAADWKAWCPEVKPGEIIDAPLTPVLYSRD